MSSILPTFFDFKNKLTILQWNIRGLHANHNYLDKLIFKYQPDIICLQETRIQYIFPPNSYYAIHKLEIENYHCITDPIKKNVICIKKDIDFVKLPEKYWYKEKKKKENSKITATKLLALSPEEKKNVVYTRHIAIKGKLKCQYHKENETIIIGNIYNSPNGIASSYKIFEQKDILIKELKKLKICTKNVKYMFMGDWNACHEAWGAPKIIKYDARYKEGKKLVEIMDNNDFNVISDGLATRFEINKTNYKRKLSHLDFAAISQYNTN